MLLVSLDHCFPRLIVRVQNVILWVTTAVGTNVAVHAVFSKWQRKYLEWWVELGGVGLKLSALGLEPR